MLLPDRQEIRVWQHGAALCTVNSSKDCNIKFSKQLGVFGALRVEEIVVPQVAQVFPKAGVFHFLNLAPFFKTSDGLKKGCNQNHLSLLKIEASSCEQVLAGLST